MNRLLAVFVAISFFGACSPDTPTLPQSAVKPVSILPNALDPSCRDGRARIYDECGSQLQILEQALEEAEVTGKIVIVNFGAEWCIWCHVFDSHLRGAAGRFSYPVEGRQVSVIERWGRHVIADARHLNEFASDNLIIAHIEADHAPDGWRVLEVTGAASHFDDEYPFIFALTPEGRFAAIFEHSRLEVRRDAASDWYRGYDRRAMLLELQRISGTSGGAASGSDQTSKE